MSTIADQVREELTTRGWSEAVLVWESRLPVRAVMGLLHENTPVTPAIAFGLARAFGTNVQVWLGLDKEN